MTDHHADRLALLSYLRYELVGPWEPWDPTAAPTVPTGEPLDVSSPVKFPDKEASYGPWRQLHSGDEILQRDPPTKRYGVGVLYPTRTTTETEPVGDTWTATDMGESAEDRPAAVVESAEQSLGAIADREPSASSTEAGPPDSDDFELSGANQYRQSSMAVSLLAELSPRSQLVIQVRGGRYRKAPVVIGDQERLWWMRSGLESRVSFSAERLLEGRRRMLRPGPGDTVSSGAEGMDLEVRVYTRPRGDGTSLITVSLSNGSRGERATNPNEACLFQARLAVEVHVDGQPLAAVLPYPERVDPPEHGRRGDPETASFDMLYRKMKTFGVGHGCAADWDGPAERRVRQVRAEPLPVVETPSITPQVFLQRSDGSRAEVTVPMGPLAGLDPGNDGFAEMAHVVDLYDQWLADRRAELPTLDSVYRAAGEVHLRECEKALGRMRRGLEFVRTGTARRAFELANEAILAQQLRTRRTARTTTLGADGRFSVTEPLDVPDWRNGQGRGSWRPFQMAFLLCSLESSVIADHPERETVELIWFPTGGGKTEAYLGLAAFAMFYRRLSDPADHGVEVLMRYTLRLLTQQQFQRASSLVCAMESIRRRDLAHLGSAEFSIGIWLGSDSTPNKRDVARRALKDLNSDDKYAENPFVILRCPWCSASMGPLEQRAPGRRSRTKGPKVAGYVDDGGTVVFRCPDRTCEFASAMPVYVIDEDIYEARPSIIVATVDKFAQLAWNPACRSLFGIGADGSRFSSPPQTIIQDELHLIAGPLGSVVGLYEAVIEQLCTDERGPVPRKPKIISSTATIRRYEDQILALYARPQVALFPPRGLDAADSFFARFATEPDGTLSPGRMYVGIHGPGLGSTQTAQVRTFAALLQGPVPLSDTARDPWWTLMVFFNSLRELGTSLSLVQSDIPDYLKVIRNRFGLAPKDRRWIRNPMEMTSRLRSDEVPRSMERLTHPAGDDPVDVCLASSIIEVGIDIDRLSLMAVVGQPKTTSQYIQVTGRVGRQWATRPALIATIYGASKPRDRSHFERFRSYHERLYAQVEPTSVTPFSPPVLDRALHAVIISSVRQNGQLGLAPWPIPAALVDKAYSLLAGRVHEVDKEEEDTLERVFRRRRSQWEQWQRRIWDVRSISDTDIPLMYRAGEYTSQTARSVSWAVPTSLRNVDAECRAEVSLRYVQEAAADV